MTRHPAPWLAAALAAAGLATACTREASTPETDARPPAGQAVEEVRDDARDGWITTKVQAQYFADADVKARQIDVTTDNGVVTLTGTVDDENARKQAVEIAKNTDGVVRVEDRLSIGPVATTGTSTTREAGETAARTADRAGDALSSAWVTTKIQSQYFADDIVKGRRIDVTTNNGVVSLSGTVESEAERQKALQIARNTEGVRRVEDRLQVAPQGASAGADSRETMARAERDLTEQMSDAGVTARVQSKFFLDDTVKARNINVNTADGVVTLEGQVAGEHEKEQAISLARSVDGVKDVQDRLQVNRSAAGPQGTTPSAGAPPSSVATTIDDAWITTRIQSRYFMDDLVKAGDVNVTTSQGVVTLTGQVPSAEAKQRAEALAKQTEGVSRIENRLTVGEGQTSEATPAPSVP